MMSTYTGDDVFPRADIDLTEMRPVAAIIMDGGKPAEYSITVYEQHDRFYVDTPGLQVIVRCTTIRKALKLALHNGGWG